jgi:uncharacterized protein (TIGR02001 family)
MVIKTITKQLGVTDMKKAYASLLLAMTTSMAASAGKTQADVYVESTRIFRGGVYNDNGVPFTKGQLTYAHDSGVIATVFAENLLTNGGNDNLFDFRQMWFNGIGYHYASEAGWSLTPMVAKYVFPEKHVMDAMDFFLFFKMGNLDAHISYMPKFFQWEDTNQIYLSVDYELALEDGLFLAPHVGHNMYSSDDPTKDVLHKNYQDWTIALRKKAAGMKLDVGWAFTNRKFAGGDDEYAPDDRPFMRAQFTF